MNLIRHKLNWGKGGRALHANLPASNDRRVMLHQAAEVGYEFWHVFAGQALRCFGLTHEAEKGLPEMAFVIYRSDIARLLLEMEYLNIWARVTGIARGRVIED